MSNQASPEARQAPARKRRPWAAVIGVLVVAAGLVGGVLWWLHSRTYVSSDDALVEATIVQVASKVGGRVHQVLVDTGYPVKRGQVLARLETDDLEASVRKAEAAVAASRKSVSQAQQALAYEQRDVSSRNVGAEAGVQGSDQRVAQAVAAAALEERQFANQLRRAQAELAAAKADLVKARADAARMEDLFAQGAVSAQDRDAVRNEAANAQARVDVAEAEVALAQDARSQIDIKKRDVEASRAVARQARATLQGAEAAHLQVALRRAQLEMAQAQENEAVQSLRLAQIALQNAEIRSPVDGSVAQRLTEPGEMASVGQPLFAITDETGPDSLWVVANLKETEIRRVRVGQPATLTVDAYPGKVFRGRVVEVRAGTQSQFSLIPAQQPTGSFTKVTQRIPVKIAVGDDEDARLVPGMSAVVSIDVRQGPPSQPTPAAGKAGSSPDGR